jgi:hypothetical protein
MAGLLALHLVLKPELAGEQGSRRYEAVPLVTGEEKEGWQKAASSTRCMKVTFFC